MTLLHQWLNLGVTGVLDHPDPPLDRVKKYKIRVCFYSLIKFSLLQ